MQIVQQQMPDLAATMQQSAQAQAQAYAQWQEAMANAPPPSAPKPKPKPVYDEVRARVAACVAAPLCAVAAALWGGCSRRARSHNRPLHARALTRWRLRPAARTYTRMHTHTRSPRSWRRRRRRSRTTTARRRPSGVRAGRGGARSTAQLRHVCCVRSGPVRASRGGAWCGSCFARALALALPHLRALTAGLPRVLRNRRPRPRQGAWQGPQGGD